MKESHELVAVCNLKLLQWLQCPRFCLDHGHFLGSPPPFYSLVTAQMNVAAVMKKISMEARTLEIQVVLVIQS